MKVIAFDLGGVIFDFDYNIALDKIEDKIRIAKQDIINALFHDDFAEDFERGLVSPRDFYFKFRDKTGLALSYDEFVPVWCDIFTLNRDSLSLIKSLKPFYKIVLISNLNILHYQFLSGRHPEVFSLFDRQVLSFKVKSTKPSKEIYDFLLSTSVVKKEELIYIDDRADLIEEAAKQGFNCIRFEDSEQCGKELKESGCYLPLDGELYTFRRVKEFLSSAKTALIGLGNNLREDDSVAVKLLTSLKGKIALKIFTPELAPENIPLREFNNIERLLAIDATRIIDDNYKAVELSDIFSLNPFSTHTSFVFFDFLKKELNLDILFLLVKAEGFDVKEGLSVQTERRKNVLEQFFLKNFSNEDTLGI